tara:strand:+ start:9068 stop:9235 length:168 start_codon:yes stop_codon:yes gene_type:complete
MTEHTDTDYARARTIIITLKEANLLNTPDFMVTEKEYLHLWDTVLKLQNKLKGIN